MSKNTALATTGADPQRDSGAFRVSKVRLSAELEQDSKRVADFAGDILNGGLTAGQVAERLLMLATRLSQRSNAAKALETVCEQELEARRGHR